MGERGAGWGGVASGTQGWTYVCLQEMATCTAPSSLGNGAGEAWVGGQGQIPAVLSGATCWVLESIWLCFGENRGFGAHCTGCGHSRKTWRMYD